MKKYGMTGMLVLTTVLALLLMTGKCLADNNSQCTTNWGSWTGTCPYIITNASISPIDIYQCGINGPGMPTNQIVPVYSPTNIWKQVGTNSCGGNLTNSENITYSVSGIIWTNFSSLLNKFPSKVTNDFSADACVNVTSSDPINCASSGLVKLATVNWHLPCPTITSCSVKATSSTKIGATIGYNFNCADGWWSWEVVTDLLGNPFPGQTATAAAQYDWSDPGDGIYEAGSPSGDLSYVTLQTIYFAPVSGGGVTNNNSTCFFQNTQTIQVIRTNSPPATPHGIVIVTVSIGGGTNATYTY